MTETTGDRLYKIRLSCGDGQRRPASQEAFAALVERETGVHYDPSTISLLERMKQEWELVDLNTFAKVDRLKRGPAWLAWGEQGGRPPLKEPLRAEPEGETTLPDRSGGPRDR